MIIKLDRMEMLIASAVGSARSVQSDGGRCENKRHDPNRCDWEIDVEGAFAEMAFAKHTGVYWGGSNLSFGGADVGEWKVRGCPREDAHLIIRPRDKPKSKDSFVLVITAKKPVFRLAGFIAAADGCTAEFKREDAWWVPQAKLSSFGGDKSEGDK